MAVKFGNNAATLLASNASSSATVLTVSDGSVFPTLSGADYTYVTLEDVNSNREIVKLTAISGNELTVVRAQDGSSARAFSASDKCELRITAALLNAVSTETVNGTSARFKFTATANQTTFSGSDDNSVTLAYNVGYIDLYLSGIRLIAGSDYTASNGTSIVLAAGASVNDIIEVVSYGTFVLADIAINDMTDVNTAGIADGSILAYDNTDSRFEKSTILSQSSSGIAVVGNVVVSGTVDGRDVATDGTKLDGVEASADVTDTANVTAAGALMDSELTSIASVKALNQGVATGNSPTFAALTSTGEIIANGGIALGDNDKATFGASDDLQIYHDGSHSYVGDFGTGNLSVTGNNLYLQNTSGETYFSGISDGATSLYYNNAVKLATTSTGIDVTGSVVADGLTVDGAVALGGNITAADGIEVRLGADNDLGLFSSSGTSHIRVNSGIFKLRADDMRFTSQDQTERMRIDSSGAIGIKKTPPSGTHTSWSQLFVGEKGSLISENANSGGFYGTWLTDNMYIAQNTGAYKNITTDQSSAYRQEAGIHQWYSQTSGSANAAITLAERMRIGSDGAITHTMTGQNTTSIDTTNSDGPITLFKNNGTTRGMIGNAEGIMNGGTGNFGIRTTADLLFSTGGGTERMRIDASGKVGIGSTPDAWKSTWSAVDIGVSGSLYAQDNNTTGLANNLFFTGSAWTHKNTGATTFYQQSEGLHLFYSNASQAAGATFSPTERMRIDSSGTVGIGVTPSTWGTSSDFRGLQIGTGGVLYGRGSGDGGKVGLLANIFRDNGADRFEYITSSYGSAYQQSDGSHYFDTAVSGTANAAVTLVRQMTIASGGNVGIGTGAPSFTAVSGSANQIGLEIQNANNDSSAHLKLTGRNNSGSPGQATSFEIVHRGDALKTSFIHGGTEVWEFDSSGHAHLGMNDSDARLTLGSLGTPNTNSSNNIRSVGTILRNNAGGSTGTHEWEINGARKLQIHSSGILQTTTTGSGDGYDIIARSTDGGDPGLELTRNGVVGFGIAVRAASDDYADFQVNAGGSPSFTELAKMRLYSSGNMSVPGTALWSAGVGNILTQTGNHYMVRTSNSPGNESIIISNTIGTGGSTGIIQYRNGGSVRGDYLIASHANGIYFNSASDYRFKENVTTITDSYLTKLTSLRPVTYTHSADTDEDTLTVHTGFIAHEVEEIFPEFVEGDKDAIYTQEDLDAKGDPETTTERVGDPFYQTVAYSKKEWNVYIVKALQELKAENEALKARIAELEG